MNWLNVKNCGYINEYHKQISLNEGKIKTGEFFKETLMEFAKVSTKIYDTTGDLAFTYKEKQLSSIFLPTFYNLSYGVIQEVPTRRKERGQESTHGWLDYWIQKDENWVYLIELKHAWQFLNGKLTKDSLDKLDKSIKQLRGIRKPEIKQLSGVETTFKISLILLPVWRNIPIEEDVDIDDEYPTDLAELEKTAKNILNDIVTKISWLGLWSTPHRMQYAFKPTHGKSMQTFPGVILIAAIV